MEDELSFTEKKAKTLEQLATQVEMLTELVNVLNNAVVALCVCGKVQGDELDKITADEYVEYVHAHVHPLTRRATEIVDEVARKLKDEIEKKAAKEAKKGGKDGKH